MDFIQSSNKQVDKFGPGKHGFAPGNPTLGVLATYFSNTWADGVQQEIINVIEAAGLTPNGAALNQLLQSIRLLGREGGAPGTVFFTARSTPPPGSIKANAAAVSRTVYADLFAAIGTTYGTGDGSTTFNVPEGRAEFIRGLDDGRGIDVARVLGSFQDGTWIRAVVQEWSGSDTDDPSTSTFPLGTSYANADATLINGGVGASVPTGARSPAGGAYSTATTDNVGLGNARVSAGSVNSWLKMRPRNLALLACIKY